MQAITVQNRPFEGCVVPLANSTLLFIKGASGGLLGCGYISVEAADKFHEAVAVVTGVATLEQMLTATVARCSAAAAALGVKPGTTTGQEALLLMNP